MIFYVNIKNISYDFRDDSRFYDFQVVFSALLAVVAAAPGLVSPWGHGIVSAPAVVSAPIVSAPIVKQAVPVATSYANVNTLRVKKFLS